MNVYLWVCFVVTFLNYADLWINITSPVEEGKNTTVSCNMLSPKDNEEIRLYVYGILIDTNIIRTRTIRTVRAFSGPLTTRLTHAYLEHTFEVNTEDKCSNMVRCALVDHAREVLDTSRTILMTGRFCRYISRYM